MKIKRKQFEDKHEQQMIKAPSENYHDGDRPRPRPLSSRILNRTVHVFNLLWLISSGFEVTLPLALGHVSISQPKPPSPLST